MPMVAFAAETDAFTTRYKRVQDGLPVIQNEIQSRIIDGLSQLNRESDGECDWDDLDSEMGSQLRRPFYGIIEGFINNSGKVENTFPTVQESIYAEVPFSYRWPMMLGAFFRIGLAGHFHQGDLLIGADKFGHFLDEGYSYYAIVHRYGKGSPEDFEKALEIGHSSEKGVFGLWTGGVFSYADLAANLDGYHFWKDLLGGSGSIHRRESRYVSCDAGQWKWKGGLDLASYLSAAWDEGMNCSIYRNEAFTLGVENRIRKLEKAMDRKLMCPVYPDRVAKMIERYGDLAPRVIHPGLLQMEH